MQSFLNKTHLHCARDSYTEDSPLPPYAFLAAAGFTDSAYTNNGSRSSSSSSSSSASYYLTAQLALDAKRWLRERDFLTMHEVSLCTVKHACAAYTTHFHIHAQLLCYHVYNCLPRS
jgi:hypothetical protein